MFESLDYVYMPSRDVAADVAWFTSALGARSVFMIDGMGTRVAMLEPTSGPPRIPLAGHLEGDVPAGLPRAGPRRGRNGAPVPRLDRRPRAGDPQDPCSFVAPGGQRLAIYERDPARRGGELRGPSRLLRSRSRATDVDPHRREQEDRCAPPSGIHGPVDVVRIEDVARPDPTEDCILVRVSHALVTVPTSTG